jgi:hypothetical protein
MTSPRPGGGSRLAPALRTGAAALALALAALSVTRFQDLRARQAAAAAWLESTGVAQDAALEREPDAERVRLKAARAALSAELDPARRAGLPPEQAARESAARLTGIAREARAVLARRPAAWDAAMILGAATYLGWSQTRDERLFTSYRSWEAPLEAALRLAPAKREPVRFLASAYLEIWPVLSPGKKATARGLLAEVLRDPRDLNRLIDPWLEAAADRREAFSVLPADPAAWERVGYAYAQRGDWRGYAAARERWDSALLAGLRRDLAEAGRRRRAGDVAGSRDLYLSVAARARFDARYRPLLERALTQCPPGPVDRGTAERLAPHLTAALDRCLLAGCGLEPAALKRLARFVREAPPHQEALAYLFAGDLNRAEDLERRSDALWSAEWAPYLIAKARVLAEGGRGEEAAAALAELHRDWQEHPLAWEARLEVARAAGDAQGAARARERLAALGRESWPATAWAWRREVARLEMVTAGAGRGLAVELDEVPPGGAVIELRLDGASLGVFPVRPAAAGTRPLLELAAPVDAGLHLLEIEGTLGGRVLPGAVLLR